MVRTRFAPSPTGFMHLGNFRTALYTWLYARKNNGAFILRLEDTDQKRKVEGAVEAIYRSMRLAGLDWDEGPDIGGEYGPYIQSERKALYLPYAKELVEKGEAYYCFCTKERLDALREEQGDTFTYDKHCMSLSKEEVEAKLAAGEPYVIRQNMPTEGVTTFHDVIFGDIEVENSTLDDQILIKTDGLPTYNFANVIDDHTMGITHIMRGNEYLSSTPKYNLLYDAFGWEIPTYLHLSTIMADSSRKLSKRHGDPSFEDLLNEGYVMEAVINYMALLGWSPGNDREMYTLKELSEVFDLKGVSKSPAIFDKEKLTWFNAEYIRQKPLEEFHDLILPYMEKVIDTAKFDTMKLAGLLQPRCEVLPDIMDKIDFFVEMPDYDIALFTHKRMKTNPEKSLPVLEELVGVLEGVESFDTETLKTVISEYITEKGVKNGAVLWPLRVAISGKMSTPGGAYEIAELLGKEETLARLNTSIEKIKAEL